MLYDLKKNYMLPVHKQNICDHKDEDQVQKVFNAGWGYAHNRDRDRGR